MLFVVSGAAAGRPLRRSWGARAAASSGERWFVGGQTSAAIPAPASIPSSEDRRLPATATPVREPFTGGNGSSTCSPAGTGFAGAGACSMFPPPARVGTSEDSLRARAQLRPAFTHRRKDDYRQPLLR